MVCELHLRRSDLWLDSFRFVMLSGPVVSGLSAWNFPSTGGAVLLVAGHNFGMFVESLSASIGHDLCSSTAWSASTLITCRSTRFSSQSPSMFVTVAAISGTLVATFSFDGDLRT
jgi:hypothetical protein